MSGSTHKVHKATFPEQLARDHIVSWSNKGETVLDPFMGSGTTGVACKLTGRKFIGIELDETYFEAGCKRIEETPNASEKYRPKGNIGIRRKD